MNVQVCDVACLFFLLYANLLVLVTLCEGNHYPFIEDRYIESCYFLLFRINKMRLLNTIYYSVFQCFKRYFIFSYLPYYNLIFSYLLLGTSCFLLASRRLSRSLT